MRHVLQNHKVLPFPVREGRLWSLKGAVGDRCPSLDLPPFTCLSLSILTCSIQRKGCPRLLRGCRAKVAAVAVAVDTVETMMGESSSSPSVSFSSSSSSTSWSSTTSSPTRLIVLTASWTPQLKWELVGDWSLLHEDWPPELGWDVWETRYSWIN